LKERQDFLFPGALENHSGVHVGDPAFAIDQQRQWQRRGVVGLGEIRMADDDRDGS